ncbi:unnamed protein product [Blepharisma stoltei]|uniref:Uncharacterized protein n=1 Tax=Blepharisma stoltei TaxID=1481888 RepID=A0AAU9JMD9_9CILI|nr:unnamed protein product [Blepharisma stoltei]
MEEFNCLNFDSAISSSRYPNKASLDLTNCTNTDTEINTSYRSERNLKCQNKPKCIQLSISNVLKANQLRGRSSSTNPSTPTTALQRKPSIPTGKTPKFPRESCSLSPTRCVIPISKVSSCDVSFSIKLQEDLLKRTLERKLLAQVVKMNNEREISVENHRRQKEEDKPMNASKKLFEKENSTCKIAPTNNKETKYSEIYARHQQLKEISNLNTTALGVCTRLNATGGSCQGLGYSQKRRKKNQENLTIEVKNAFSYSMKNGCGSPFSSKDLEKRYNKLTGQLDTISQKIQDVIDKCSD